jgi:uncharacterized membrane-anchored protein
MTRTRRGWILAVVHVILALSVAGKFLYDRQTLPRVWVRTVPYDPVLPLRGRYVRLAAEVDFAGTPDSNFASQVSLQIADGRLTARQNPPGDYSLLRRNETWQLQGALAYFIPEGIPDPSFRPEGEELWVEVSLPASGLPRPVRLGVKTKGSEIVPLDLH